MISQGNPNKLVLSLTWIRMQTRAKSMEELKAATEANTLAIADITTKLTDLLSRFPVPQVQQEPKTYSVPPPRYELSFFDGSNPLDWIFQAERFFAYHSTPNEQRIDLAGFYMTRQALTWFQWMHRNKQLSSWFGLAEAIQRRFGPSSFTDLQGASTGSSMFSFTASGGTNSSFPAPSPGRSLFGNSTPVFGAATASSTAVTQAVPFQFGSSSTSPVSGTTAIPSSSGSSLFGSSAPAFSSAPSFGLSSAVASTELKSGSSTSSSTTNIFGSAFSSTPSFGLSSAVASSETKFGSAWQPSKSSAFGSSFGSPSTGFSFGASSASSSPVVFGYTSNAGASTGSSMFSFTASGGTHSSFPAPSPGRALFGNSTPVFGAATASPNNTDQMSMEDSMAEDSTTQTPTPSIPTFGQAPASTPGFMFGSATPTQSTVPFQFGGQTNQPPSQNTNQPPSQNPFQAYVRVEFNAGGSFSLGSGRGDKSGRRILRVKSRSRRK